MQDSVTTLSLVHKYVGRNSNDRIKYLVDKTSNKCSFKLRSNFSEKVIDKLSEKKITLNNLSSTIEDPFEKSKITELTMVQKYIKFKVCLNNYLIKYGSVALEASCGCGKTLAALYVIYHFKCKTLIISTRNAVLDQWYIVIKNLFPKLKVQIGGKIKFSENADIWILTPQYLNAKGRIESEDFNIKPSLIIYDEIHSIMNPNKYDHSNEFSNALKYPFIRVLSKEWDELPLMLGLSATYPRDTRLINLIFGEIKSVEDKSKESIINIPINLFDLRDHERYKLIESGMKKDLCENAYQIVSKDFQKNNYKTGNIFVDNYINYCIQKVGIHRFTENYIKLIDEFVKLNFDNYLDKYNYEPNPVHEFKALEYFMKNIQFISEDGKLINNPESKIDEIKLSKINQGIIMLSKIDYSVWASLMIHHNLKCDVLLIRTGSEYNYFFPKDKYQNYEFKTSITLKEIIKDQIGEPIKNYHEYLDKCEIIVSTVSRMKEGFSNERLTWGIVTQYPYSPTARVQIAGRVRRRSNNPEIKSAIRKLFVNSKNEPTNEYGIYYLGWKGSLHSTYDWEFENELFKRENIKYISKHLETK